MCTSPAGFNTQLLTGASTDGEKNKQEWVNWRWGGGGGGGNSTALPSLVRVNVLIAALAMILINVLQAYSN